MRKVVVTGAAGFVGYHLSEALLKAGHDVLGIDQVNDYYSVELKEARLANLQKHSRFQFSRLDICDDTLPNRLREFGPSVVIHLAAQAGVRHSINHPLVYAHSNLEGFVKVIETAKTLKLDHFIYASSSSVYGNSKKTPFSTEDPVDHPVSLYAATKRANELVAHSYSHLFGLPATGLRFFTVYGSWGRPDMAYFSFTQKMLKGESIELFNNGDLERDFTHISDIVESIVRLMDKAPKPDPLSGARHKIFNIGASSPTKLKEFVSTLADLLQVTPKIKLAPMQPGDVKATFADVADLERTIDYAPKVSLRDGLREFVTWYLSFYGKN